jgi:uncharacterized protein (TIGR02117 family)
MHTIMNALKLLGYTLLAFIIFAIIYASLAMGLAHVPVNRNYQAPPISTRTIDIYVRSNGVHTDIIVPARSSTIDWYTWIPAQSLGKHHTLPYMSFGWGDRGFYLETPEWKDLKASTAILAMTGLSRTAMHVEALPQPKVGKYVRHLRISIDQYKTMIADIQKSFTYKENHGVQLIPQAHYNDRDAFFEGEGSYSLFMTCNQWTRNILSNAGIKTAAFTLMDDGVMRFL